MSMLDALELALREQPRKPPIERWHPPLSGDIDICIDSRGDWYHEGARIARMPLVKLFASILRREDDGHYYLVTPIEKWRIRVDETPLLAVDMDIVAEPEQKIIFRLNTDELVALDAAHELIIEHHDRQLLPKIMLERGLSAKLTTAAYYRLIDRAEIHGDMYGVQSCGKWFFLVDDNS